MKKYLLFGAVAIAVLVIILISSPSKREPEDASLEPGEETAEMPEGKLVRITKDGFVPMELTVKKGETVTFRNETDNPAWPASGLHPTHELYPEKGGCISSAFDACHALKNGELWNFTFNDAGTWKYHDHLAPSSKGTIIVTEGEPTSSSPTAPPSSQGPTSPPPSGAEIKTFAIDAKNFSFSKAELRVKYGDRVKIVLTVSEGFHDWVLDEFSATTKRANTGVTVETEFTASQTGTFEYYCSVGDHRAKGMVGKLVVG